MKIITNFISFLALFFLVGDVLADRYENTAVPPVNDNIAASKNILSVVPDNGVTDKDVQQHFLDAGGVTMDIVCPAYRSFDMSGIADNLRLSVLLDYKCRAP